MDIEIATNSELINELMNRQTFVGLVINSRDNHKSDSQVHSDFDIHSTANLETSELILKKVLSDIKEET